MTNSKILAKLASVLLYSFLGLWALTTIIPLVWVFINSFKPSDDILLSSISLPKVWTLKNYIEHIPKFRNGSGKILANASTPDFSAASDIILGYALNHVLISRPKHACSLPQ
ncbi:MAG: hypothetical protein LBT59_28880 [Clostridiales bacterium]|jgi:ABC-type glycerol-3-phosphate transport system permease component|nr:hypothetical protein [Clostridiales bacterium]